MELWVVVGRGSLALFQQPISPPAPGLVIGFAVPKITVPRAGVQQGPVLTPAGYSCNECHNPTSLMDTVWSCVDF